MKNFSQLATPLYNLLKKGSKFVWDTNCATSFLQLKEVLTTLPILRGPNCILPFHIHMDASDYDIDAGASWVFLQSYMFGGILAKC